MKELCGSLFWMAMCGFLVFGVIEPRFYGIIQSFMWVYLSLLLVCVVGAFVSIANCDDKEKLVVSAKKRSKFMNTVGWIKSFTMFGALAYSGFTVLAAFYLVTALLARTIPLAAETRLKELE